jgi:phosphatidylserine decarboxylase
MKAHEIFNRKTGLLEPEISPNTDGLKFLYTNALGKAMTGLIINKRQISVLYGKYVKSKFSVSKISGFIKQYCINVLEINRPLESFTSLNDFFIRELKPGSRPVDPEPGHLISPADSRLLVFDLAQKNSLPVKGYWYSLTELIKDDTLAHEYDDGWCFVYRLAPCDYHRFCYIDCGQQEVVRRIKGVLHSVNPIALASVKSLMAGNYRELTTLHTENFGTVLHLEIGALMVGKVMQHNLDKCSFNRGDEKGWFEFGGSTIVQLFRKGTIIPDNDILEHSANYIETLVKMGERVGNKA